MVCIFLGTSLHYMHGLEKYFSPEGEPGGGRFYGCNAQSKSSKVAERSSSHDKTEPCHNSSMVKEWFLLTLHRRGGMVWFPVLSNLPGLVSSLLQFACDQIPFLSKKARK